jgi:ribosomal protein L21
MYAIFETGGKQYKVAAGDVLRIEKIPGNEGDLVNFGKVSAFSDGNGSLQVGTPYLEAATINATIVSFGKSEKVIIFKFKSKKDYRKKQGHRQPYTEIEIENFTVGGKTLGEKPEKPVVEEKPEPKEAPKEEKVEEKKATVEVISDDVAVTEDVVDEVVADEIAAEESVADVADEVAADATKHTKASLMAKLDELGVDYAKSAKKDELLALHDEHAGK